MATGRHPLGQLEVLDTTLESAECNNLTVGLLPQRQDLDHLRDLKRWQASILIDSEQARGFLLLAIWPGGPMGPR